MLELEFLFMYNSKHLPTFLNQHDILFLLSYSLNSPVVMPCACGGREMCAECE